MKAATAFRPPRVAVVGHVPHVSIGRAPALPLRGDIVHLAETVWIPGGGGGVAFFQLLRSPGTVHLFTAVGSDSVGTEVLSRLSESGGQIHAARREGPHTRDLALITPDGERTIFVLAPPIHPTYSDPLPWDLLTTCDAVFFTAKDPGLLRLARAAPVLVVTARRAETLVRSGVRADVVVGSTSDPREPTALADYPVQPHALVVTEGGRGGRIEHAGETERFPAAPAPKAIGGSYGAGDTFAAALTWYLATGLPLPDACRHAARHAAAVLRGPDPISCHLPLAWPDAHGPVG